MAPPADVLAAISTLAQPAGRGRMRADFSDLDFSTTDLTRSSVGTGTRGWNSPGSRPRVGSWVSAANNHGQVRSARVGRGRQEFPDLESRQDGRGPGQCDLDDQSSRRTSATVASQLGSGGAGAAG